MLVLRRAALDAKLPLSPLDKAIAIAPAAYTFLCFVAAGVLADRASQAISSASGSVALPLFGALALLPAIWVLGLLTGLAALSPPVVVFTVETYFARRLPELVGLGRRAVYGLVTGVPPPLPERPRRGAARP